MNTDLTFHALLDLLTELSFGPADDASWILNPGDLGLSQTLKNLPAAVASQQPTPGQNSIASHTHHLVYGLSLLNRWAGGEENPFADADWNASWQKQTVNEDEWKSLVAELEKESQNWIAAVQEPREWDRIALTGAIGSAVHLAYHFGAIRQLIVFVENRV
ncbi:MAG: DinB family protein [Lacipirellulaceae bacterium]